MSLLQNKKLSLPIIIALLIIVLQGFHTQVQAENTDKRAEAKFLWILGREYLLSPSYYQDTALKQFNDSLSLYREIGDIQSEADILTWVAVVNFENYARNNAMNYLKEAQEIYNKLNSEPGEKAAFKDVGKAMKALTLFEEASNFDKEQEYRLKKCKDVLQIVREMGEKRYEGKLLFYIAYSGLTREEEDSKFEYFNEALKIFEQINDRRGIIAVLKSAGAHAKHKKKIIPRH